MYTDWYWLHSLVHLFHNWLQSVPAGTGYTALYTCFNNWLQCTDWYWLHSLVHLLQQQLVTVYWLVLTTQPCTLASTTGYRVYRLVLATQPCTLASTTGYSVPTGTGYTVLYTCFNNNWLQCTDWYWLHSLVHLLQQLVIECTGWYWLPALYTCFNNWLQCTDWYWLHSLVHLLQQQLVTVYWLVLTTQPCTLASTTGYRVYRLVLATQPCTFASTTGYRVYRLVLATQSCSLASTYRLQVY